MKTSVYYHGNCPDGFTAAWVARILYPTATFVPVHYTDEWKTPPPDEPGFVYFIDYCPPLDVLHGWRALGHSITVLDHHKSAEPILKMWGGHYVFANERSGAGIAWDYFFAGSMYPPLVAYAQDRDLWQHKLQHSREVNAYIMSFQYTFENWMEIDVDLRTAFRECVDQGTAIERYKAKDTAMICAQTTWEFIGGHKVPVVNATSLWSEVGERLLALNDAPFVASFSDTKHGTRVWSLRSRQGADSFDVAQIAGMYGGGGHRNAAGFRTPRPPALDDKGITRG